MGKPTRMGGLDRPQYLASVLGIPLESLDGELERKRGKVSDREFKILCSTYGIGCEPSTYEVIGQGFGVSRERARQIEKKAVRTIRMFLKQEQYSSLPVLEQPVDVYFCKERALRAGVRLDFTRIRNALISSFEFQWENGQRVSPTLGQLLETFDIEAIERIPNLGRKSIDAMVAMLATDGLKFRDA